MGNSNTRLSRSRSGQDQPEIDQQIVTVDSESYMFTDFEPPSEVKPVNNLLIPNLKLTKSVFILKKDTVEVKPVLTKFAIAFQYDAEERCSARFRFSQTHMGLKNGVPSFSDPAYETAELELGVGKHQSFELDYFHVSEFRELTLESCAFTQERKFVPILIVVRSLESDFTYFAMCGLSQQHSGEWKMFVTKRRIRVGDFGYQVQEVYGLNESEYSSKSDAEKDERIKKCSICLDRFSNTILMPCRHLCLCSQCSINLSLHIGRCPMCRTVVTQILHINTSSL